MLTLLHGFLGDARKFLTPRTADTVLVNGADTIIVGGMYVKSCIDVAKRRRQEKVLSYINSLKLSKAEKAQLFEWSGYKA